MSKKTNAEKQMAKRKHLALGGCSLMPCERRASAINLLTCSSVSLRSRRRADKQKKS